MKHAWQMVLQQVEGQNVGLYAAIRDAHVRADADCLTLALPSSLALSKAATPDNKQLLAAIIERTTGARPTLELTLDREAAAPAPPEPEVPDAGLTIAQRIALAKRELEASELPDDD